jgi:hypothetical protein
MQQTLWTSDAVYPYLYRFTDRVWLWYLPDSDNPRRFYNTRTAIWEAWP